MYEYRRMTAEQRAEVVAVRMAREYPWHAPPHFGGESTFMLSAACFEHEHIMQTEARLTEFAEALVGGFEREAGGAVHAWVVLANHWHVLGRVDLGTFRQWIARLHNGKSTQWNREDAAPGRKVWHGFTDRWIRNEGHYYASLNYIHGNPVKHGYVPDARDWPWSSVHEYLKDLGQERLDDMLREYPVMDYGKGWDD